MLILVLAANTSFADFPRLAIFHAGDNFMPRQFTKRGHRLVFSNGIIFLAGAAIVTLIVTGGEVEPADPALRDRRVHQLHPVARPGMAKHHITPQGAGLARRAVINGIGAVLSLLVDWSSSRSSSSREGAWVIIAARADHGRRARAAEPAVRGGGRRAARGRAEATRRSAHPAPPRGRRARRRPRRRRRRGDAVRPHAAARRPARSALRPRRVEDEPARRGVAATSASSRFPLDIVECPDRRIARAALELAAELTADDDTEVTVLIPAASTPSAGTGCSTTARPNAIVAALRDLPHCNVTDRAVPPRTPNADTLPRIPRLRDTASQNGRSGPARTGPPAHRTCRQPTLPGDRTRRSPIVPSRSVSTIAGRCPSRSECSRWGGNPALECTSSDETGSIAVVFFGRREDRWCASRNNHVHHWAWPASTTACERFSTPSTSSSRCPRHQ